MTLRHKIVTLFDTLFPSRSKSQLRPDSLEHSQPRPDSLEHSQHRPDSLEHSPFKKLPVELIISIAEFLPLPAAASFTLACRPFWYIAGNQYLHRLSAKGHTPDRLAFLELLERDMPRQILCYDCQRLCSGAMRRHNPKFSGDITKCPRADYRSYVEYYIQQGFSSLTFRLAMKIHHRGLDCSEQLSLLSGIGYPFGRGHNYQYEYTPRIINGCFILRHQAWFMFPVGYKVIVPDLIYSDICPHWKFNFFGSSKLQQKLACRCEICPTEFQIDIKVFPKVGVALVITRWLDLGEGHTVSDPKYASHIAYYHRDPIDTPVSFEAGSIKAAYEGEAVDMKDLLTPKYTRHLFESKPLPLLKDS
ncbi:hypothetical protein V502_05653 [Pseudogymnoascus sp. VKM F-4520 (FW-2644)]|nr:hypothetical protein V502_05653 [Pseudogymnoascus sp. VKM F-4520 (FW-2644)]